LKEKKFQDNLTIAANALNIRIEYIVGFYVDLPTYLSRLYAPTSMCTHDAATGV